MFLEQLLSCFFTAQSSGDELLLDVQGALVRRLGIGECGLHLGMRLPNEGRLVSGGAEPLADLPERGQTPALLRVRGRAWEPTRAPAT